MPGITALIIAYHYPPIAGSSGLHRMVSLSRELVNAGHQVHVLSVSLNNYQHIELSNLDALPKQVQVHRCWAFDSVKSLSIAGKYPGFFRVPDSLQSWILTGTLRGLALVRKHAVNWVISSYPIASAHCIGYNIARFSAARWVADFRDPMAQPGYPELAIQHRAFVAIEKRVLKQATLLTFTTEGAKRFYRNNYPELEEARCLVVNNGYDEKLFSSLAEVEPPKEKVLLHSGALYPSERDPSQFFDALVILKQYLLDSGFVVRLRATGHDGVIQQMIDERQLQPLVEIAPLVSNQQALAEMQHAYLLLVLQAANCNDQIPAKAYECLRSLRGILCLAAPEGATAQLLENQPGCWSAPLDSTERIAKQLQSLCLTQQLKGDQRTLEQISGFERGHQMRLLVRWLEQGIPDSQSMQVVG